MKNATRLLFTAFVSQLALLNAVDAAVVTTSKFTVEPSVQQTLETRMQESSEFLNQINIVPVDEMKGEKLGLGISGTIAGRTNTAAGNRRVGVDPTALDAHGYECKQTNFDVALKYAKLDMWAKFPDFETRIRDVILRRQALDRILIGFNGTSAAAATKRLGGLRAVRVPGFPAGKVFITRLDNLSIYYQDGKRRRMVKDEPELDQITDYQSSNEAYVIEDLEGACLIENIQEHNA